MNNKIQVTMVPIEKLTPYKHNPRNNEDAVKPVAESIKAFGFKVPMVIDKDGVIVAGHTRYEAAKQLGMNEVPCVVADDLNDAQIKAFRLADNKVGEIASWNFEFLESEFEELEEMKDGDEFEMNFDMADFGFNEPSQDIDLNQFFEDSPEGGVTGKESKLITCPHCGKPIQL